MGSTAVLEVGGDCTSVFAQSTHGSGRMFQARPNREARSTLGIPPTAVRGCFKLGLTERRGALWESHPRQREDVSSSASQRGAEHSGHPTHGSGWMFQARPTRELLTTLAIPPTAVGELFRPRIMVEQNGDVFGRPRML